MDLVSPAQVPNFGPSDEHNCPEGHTVALVNMGVELMRVIFFDDRGEFFIQPGGKLEMNGPVTLRCLVA